MSCPDSCSDDTAQSDCLCTCDVDSLIESSGSLSAVLDLLVDSPEWRPSLDELSDENQVRGQGWG